MRRHVSYFILALLVPAFFAVLLFERSLIFPSDPQQAGFIPSVAPVFQQPEDVLVVYYHERRPYYVTTRTQVHGLIADRVNWVFKEADIPYEWHKTPAKRELEMIRSDVQRACAVGWFKTPEREAFGQFTLPIYMDSPTMAVARVDNERIHSGEPLAQTLDNYRLRLLRKDGYSYGTFIDERIKRHAPREVVTTADNFSMLKMIHSHRADYFFIAREEAEDLILCSGLPIEDFQMIHFSDMPQGNKRYLICSPQIEKMTLLRLNRAIKAYLLGSLVSNPLVLGANP